MIFALRRMWFANVMARSSVAPTEKVIGFRVVYDIHVCTPIGGNQLGQRSGKPLRRGPFSSGLGTTGPAIPSSNIHVWDSVRVRASTERLR